MVIGHKALGFVYAGRNFMSGRGFEISGGFYPRDNVRMGEIRWRGNFRWLAPEVILIFRRHYDMSVSWTGRDLTVVGLQLVTHGRNGRSRVWQWA